MGPCNVSKGLVTLRGVSCGCRILESFQGSYGFSYALIALAESGCSKYVTKWGCSTWFCNCWDDRFRCIDAVETTFPRGNLSDVTLKCCDGFSKRWGKTCRKISLRVGRASTNWALTPAWYSLAELICPSNSGGLDLLPHYLTYDLTSVSSEDTTT